MFLTLAMKIAPKPSLEERSVSLLNAACVHFANMKFQERYIDDSHPTRPSIRTSSKGNIAECL